MSESIQVAYERFSRLLADHGQDHLLRFWSRLDSRQQSDLIADLQEVDFDQCARLIDPYVRNRPKAVVPGTIEPAETLPAQPGPHQSRTYDEARAAGEAAIRAGKVAAFTVAGGQGTRLGFDGPKGALQISPIRHATLFQLFAEYLRGVERRYATRPLWFIMTSPLNHDATLAFFTRQHYFGLARDQVTFFQQGQMPAFHPDGRIAMSAPHRLALSPDGHGGSLRALAANGCLQQMKAAGVQHISYFQVDNPLVHCIDPLFIGLHVLRQSEMSSKAVTKIVDREKVGNFCIADGTLQVIEYSDLPDELADAKNADGSRRLNAGSIAIHVLDRAFVERLTSAGSKIEMPWHRADKAVPVIDDNGEPRRPTSPNVVKLEMFVFDAIPLARSPLVIYTDRAEEFSPVKNAEGADSPAATRRDLVRRAARWLEACGVSVPRDAGGEPTVPIEISPAFALDARDLRDRRVQASVVADGRILLA